MRSEVKATIRSDHTSGRTVQTVTAPGTETVDSTNKSFVMRLFRVTGRVTNSMAIDVVTTAEVIVAGPGNQNYNLIQNAAIQSRSRHFRIQKMETSDYYYFLVCR